MVFIGTRRITNHPVLVGWTKEGGELGLREQAQATTDEDMWVLGIASTTPDVVARIRAKHKKSRRHGHWFSCTKEFLSGVLAIEDEGLGDLHRMAKKAQKAAKAKRATSVKRHAQRKGQRAGMALGA
jgi:hypothetical protein